MQKLRSVMIKILFDTVFTSIGSATKTSELKTPTIKNKISSIKLRGSSGFIVYCKCGWTPGDTSFGEMEIAAQDSMYVFAG